ncbi:MAG TPA: hydantoinase/oxoprolinase family protein, partial [Micromonosporaceae bacterium]
MAGDGQTSRRVRVGVDTGGTFTDVVALDDETGELAVVKTPSTPADPAIGFLTGVRAALARIGAGPADLTSISHGTTVATNQLLEGDLGRIGLITTEGFEFLLEIARQSVPDGYGNSYFWVKPPRIVPAELVRTVRGRLDHTGAELRPFDDGQARQVARWFRDQEVTTVGVCLLHAYANPDHEVRMGEILADEHPDAVVSLSSRVLREYREYERAMTTLVDAAVKVRVGRYVDRLGTELAAYAPGVPFAIMKSNGGVLSADEVVHQPITTVLSGPAAGALGAALVTSAAGYRRVVTLDGGGTSTDVSVVLDGEPTLTTEGTIGGYPSKIPMIDIVTVGAGGGSVAWLSPEQTLRVGPRSAGADPGPMCYGRGGTEPTVTDAHLVLGRIPEALLGGELRLEARAARTAIEARIARPLRLSVDDAAAGIVEITDNNMARAIRTVSVGRGHDPRRFALIAFGGAGPLHACRLAELLDIPTIVIPPRPGVLSTWGLLDTDIRTTFVRTAGPAARQAASDGGDVSAVEATWRELEAQARAWLDE